MLATLAQQTAPQEPTHTIAGVFDVMVSVFSRPDTLAHPRDLADSLSSLHIAWAVLFLVAGLTCMLNGYKYYRVVVVTLSAAIGLFVGYFIGQRLEAAESRYVIAGCLGLLCGVGCMPLMKYSVAVMGGLAGAFIGANLWSAVCGVIDAGGTSGDNFWVGALIGLVVFGMLAFILFRLSVVMFTSVAGATVAVLGAMSLLLKIPSWQDSVTSSISAHAIVMPLLVFVPAIIGLILQESYQEGGKPAS